MVGQKIDWFIKLFPTNYKITLHLTHASMAKMDVNSLNAKSNFMVIPRTVESESKTITG